MDNDIVVVEENEFALMPVMDISLALERRKALQQFVSAIMVSDVDFGVIPGTSIKPVLLQAGAEKLTTFFGLSKHFEIIERIENWRGRGEETEPFFYYLYRCRLYRGDLLIAETDGSANSWESKYRWRWVQEDQVPESLDVTQLERRGGKISQFEFAIEKGETTGQYGKPAEYWKRFHDEVAAGRARHFEKETRGGKKFPAVEVDSTLYRVPNDDIASQVNAIQKMAQKRAFVGATKLAVNASSFFTQDMDDQVRDIIVEGKVTEVKKAPPKAKPATHEQAPRQAILLDDNYLRRKFHATGAALYGPDNWDKKRHELVASIVGDEGASSNQLSIPQANRLIAGMQAKIAKLPDSDLVRAQIENPESAVNKTE